MYPEPHLVDEVLMRKIVREFSDSVQDQVAGIALLQGRDVAGEISAEQLRVPCQRLLQGARGDVFGHRIDQVGPFVVRFRPEVGELFVGFPAEDDGVGRTQLCEAVGHRQVWLKPSLQRSSPCPPSCLLTRSVCPSRYLLVSLLHMETEQ